MNQRQGHRRTRTEQSQWNQYVASIPGFGTRGHEQNRCESAGEQQSDAEQDQQRHCSIQFLERAAAGWSTLLE